jgi:hypothetical protein
LVHIVRRNTDFLAKLQTSVWLDSGAVNPDLSSANPSLQSAGGDASIKAAGQKLKQLLARLFRLNPPMTYPGHGCHPIGVKSLLPDASAADAIHSGPFFLQAF